MNKVSVLDKNKNPLAPCSPRRCRILLSTGKAFVLKRFPFTIILKREVDTPVLLDLRLKIDPGSKTTGIAIVNQSNGEVIFAAELSHHGHLIKESLDSRRSLRRGRRNRKTRYRKARFLNRTRPEGWLAPSSESRISNIITWTNRLSRAYSITCVAVELVKFDMQLMNNPEISGIEYQQGELQGYEVREYLLEKFRRSCCYCGKKDVPLQIEHINPKSRGGTNKISNLCLSCKKCNLEKGTKTAKEFGFPLVQAQANKPLKDAAAVNTIRLALLTNLKFNGYKVETGSGGLTKFNRTRQGLGKSHWIDAACVGRSTPTVLQTRGVSVLAIKSSGYGSRQMCRTDKFGFPKVHKTRNKTFAGWKTGDIAVALETKGKVKFGCLGKVTIRQRNSFLLDGNDIHMKYLKRVHRSDGFSYSLHQQPC